jgi:hypothetical protein
MAGMTTSSVKLTRAEQFALLKLKGESSILVSQIDDTPGTDCFGDPVPSLRAFRSLEKKGLCFQTIEEPVELKSLEGEPFMFTFTESIELTEAGEEIALGLLSF